MSNDIQRLITGEETDTADIAEDENQEGEDEELSADINMKFVYISIIFHCVTGIMYGAMSICIKYAVHFYSVNHNEFVILSMLFGSILGIFVGLSMGPHLSQLFSQKVFQVNYL